jgi:hypothetical protein
MFGGRSGAWARAGVLAAVVIAAVDATGAAAQSLRGSHAALVRQNQQAHVHDFTFLTTPEDIRRFVREGWLVRLEGNSDYKVHGASFPYARPEVRLFVTRLASQYRRACGERLVVTSATRPSSRQPPNASRLSVHPTGMAVDLRRSRRAACRAWLERVLLDLERQGVLDATLERRPPHYHIAVFPQPYATYVARLEGRHETAGSPSPTARTYRVRPGDSLWKIAIAHGISVALLKEANDLRSSRIRPGKKLVIPPGSRDAESVASSG